MKPMTLLKGMTEIDDRYIEMAAPEAAGADKSLNSGKIAMFPRRWMAVAAAAVLIISVMTIAGPFLNPKPTPEVATSPLVECASLEEAEEITGIPFGAPESFGDLVSRKVTVISGKIIEVSYMDEKGNAGLRIRKGHLTEDISGDYSVYPVTDSITVNNTEITAKGETNLYYYAEWNAVNFSYSISCESGLTNDEIAGLAGTMMK